MILMPLIGFVFIPIMIGLLLYIVKNRFIISFSIAAQLFLVIMSIFYIKEVNDNKVLIELLSTYKIPIGMSLKLDKLSLVTLILNNFLFLLMMIHSYHKRYADNLFVFLFICLQGIINGIFLSNDFFNIYLLVEIATIIVSILIMYKKDSQSMYDGMLYLMVNMTAMGFFLMGVGYIYKIFGVLDFTSVGEMMTYVTDPGMLILPFSFLITGVSLKAAFMPLFSWLPKAHGTASAPSEVSSILSGIFVKTGVYLFIRMIFLFSTQIDVSEFFLFMGILTSVAGFTFAIAQKDIKLILSYHTISQVGLIMIGVNIGGIASYDGAIYHILTHGVFKSLLFLLAGLCTEMYGTREISEMKDLWRKSKLISVGFLISILSITGSPFFSGGYSKYMIGMGHGETYQVLLFRIISLGTMISFVKFFSMIFGSEHKKVNFEISLNQKSVIIVMSAACIALGLFGNILSGFLIGAKVDYDIIKQTSKLPEFIITYIMAAIIYTLLIKDRGWSRYIRGIELSFNSICISIFGFFSLTLLYMQFI